MRAFLLDEALGVLLMQEQQRARAAPDKAPTSLPDGARFATEDEYDDPLPIRRVG